MDIKDLELSKHYDVVLAHLFLGEAEKFGRNKFNPILDKLFEIKTRYLVLVNGFENDVDHGRVLKKIAETGTIKKVAYEKSESAGGYIGILVEKL